MIPAIVHTEVVNWSHGTVSIRQCEVVATIKHHLDSLLTEVQREL